MLFVAGLVVKLFIFDLAGWQVIGLMRYAGDHYSFSMAAMRLLDFGAIIAFLYAAYYMLSGNVSARAASVVFGATALALLFVFTTLETNTFLWHYVPGLRAGGVSILWSIFALALDRRRDLARRAGDALCRPGPVRSGGLESAVHGSGKARSVLPDYCLFGPGGAGAEWFVRVPEVPSGPDRSKKGKE